MSILDFLFKKKVQNPTRTRIVYSGKIIAYSLCYYDLDAYMWNGKIGRPDCCPICNNTLRKIANDDFSFTMRNRDLGETYDGYVIASEKFRKFCLESNYNSLRIEPLKGCEGLYLFEPSEVFGLGYERYGTTFTTKRECCGSYDETICPPIMKSSDFRVITDDFIMRSEYMFGSYESKSFDIIVGKETKKRMLAYGLKGIDFHKILDSEGLKTRIEEYTIRI